MTKFLITYVYRHDETNHTGQFEFESEQEPVKSDNNIIEAARRDVSKFQNHELGTTTFSIKIELIEKIPEEKI